MACCQCEGIERQFGSRTAERELKRFRRRGAKESTRLLLREITERITRVPSATLLDIGGGIGAIHHVLLDARVREATQVDISPEYLNVARREATARGHIDLVRFIRGDFVELAPTLPSADVVTLDRVICCYPDMEQLVSHAAEKTHHLLGAVYPRDVWWVRLGVGLVNRLTQLRRCPVSGLRAPAGSDRGDTAGVRPGTSRQSADFRVGRCRLSEDQRVSHRSTAPRNLQRKAADC